MRSTRLTETRTGGGLPGDEAERRPAHRRISPNGEETNRRNEEVP
jgi:hypothetical protein